jgi:hypothetical protein
VIVVQGDDQTVSTGGPDSFGILDNNQVAIVNEVLAVYPDVFDTIQIYTSFIDDASASLSVKSPRKDWPARLFAAVASKLSAAEFA